MGYWSNMKKVIYKSDFFYTAEVLRFKGENENRTIFGGILSILIIFALLLTFSSKVINTFEKAIITSTVSSINSDDPTSYLVSNLPGQPFMFGVEIWHQNLNRNDFRFFNVRMKHAYLETGTHNLNRTVHVPLEPCTVQHWANYPTIQSSFDRLSIKDWLCMPLNSEFDIQGKYASPVSKTIEI